MPSNLAQKLITDHLVDGTPEAGSDIALRIDQTLTQDATGTLVMLQLEAMALDRVRTEVSVQYVDHNLIQQDHRNPDDHRFLYSAARRFGIWYSGPGNGVSHPTHMQYFGVPGKTLLGADSHTPAAGALGMLAIGAGGIDVALAMTGEPFRLRMPTIWGVRLEGQLPDWVSAKDVILEMLRRHGTDGGRGRIIEYHGPGLAHLSAMDRHVIANMGAELGATSTVFPSDERTRAFLASCGREADWAPLAADSGCDYDHEDRIDLAQLVPLIARPSSPGNVVPVAEVAGEPIYQAYIGSSANPGYRDFAVCARMVQDRTVAPGVSFDINPASRSILEALTRDGHLSALIAAGARLHQAGCNGCIGMGQAPASGQNSLRTTPRNFSGRSGTEDDAVWLCSPETATASALTGEITDPRTLDMPCPRPEEPESLRAMMRLLIAPLPSEEAQGVELIKGPNIASIPAFDPLPDRCVLPVLLSLGDLVTTDHIMPAGADVLPYRSNIPRIADFVFRGVDRDYPKRARAAGDHALVAGRDYGQGSSREHAAIAPRYLGLRVVLATSFARIHRQNLVSYGILPLLIDDETRSSLSCGRRLTLEDIYRQLRRSSALELSADGKRVCARHDLSAREIDILEAGGIINYQAS